MLILLSFYQGGTMFYDNFKAACERKGTTITAVLADIGRASGNTGGWKMGKFPRLDIVMEIAEHLQISIDELAKRWSSRLRYQRIASNFVRIFCVLIWFLLQRNTLIIRGRNIS